MTIKLGSLFDGSGGFPLAGALCGVEPVWAAEVEPYPIAVTRSRFPNMKHLGDISKINGAEIEPVDIITFGSPCQDLSVAGLRKGLKHEVNGDEETTRSGLFMEAVRIIKEMREATNGKYPRFALWENVPGAFSSNKGEDFRIVCEELIKIVEPSATMPSVPKVGTTAAWAYADSYCGDGWSLAYRVFDAQYWGVPQRRRRIHLVVDFRGTSAREVLFEREGLRGYFAESGATRQATAADAEGGSLADDRERRGTGGERGRQLDAVTLEPGIASREGGHIYDGVSGTLRANAGDNQMAVAYAVDQGGGKSSCSVSADLSPTLACTHGGAPAVAYPEDALRVADPVVAIDQQGGKGGANYAVGVMPTMCSDSHGTPHAVAYTMVVRSGVDVDSKGKSAGKGALIQTERASTINTVQDQYLFQPTIDGCILDDQGGQQIGVRTDGKSPTLRAEMHGNVPAVLEPVVYDGANVTSPINASNPQPGDPCHALLTDSRNYVVVPICCIDGDKIGKAERAGGSGLGIREGDAMYTLTAKDAGTHSVCIPIADQATRFSGKRGDKADGKGNGLGVGAEGDPVFTLTGGDRHAVAYGTESTPIAIDRAAFNQGANALYTPQFLTDGTVSTLVAKGPSAVCVRYIVRRLTPTECARLQGFADWWGHIEKKTELTDEEYRFWLDVRNTHAAINGKAVKDYNKPQMLTWYNKLWSDGAEYKMWGNGIALPPALYCMQGITDVLNREEDDSWML